MHYTVGCKASSHFQQTETEGKVGKFNSLEKAELKDDIKLRPFPEEERFWSAFLRAALSLLDFLSNPS